MAEEKSSQFFKLNYIFIGLLVLAAFVIGNLYTRVQLLEKKVEEKIGREAVKPTVVKEKANFGGVENFEKLKESDHLRGERNARLILFEYSDFECPFCKRFHETAKKVISEYQGKVAWVYRHFPLDELHPKARKESEATECAAELGGNEAFWKMADKIYEVTPSNNGLDLSKLPDYALQIGIDKNKFKSCLDSGRYAKRVEDDYQSGLKAGVNGTPATILFDTKTGKTRLIPGALPYENLKSIIDEMLNEKS